MKVKKRDGRLVTFDFSTVVAAIDKAATASQSPIIDMKPVWKSISDRIDGRDIVSVAEIQDAVEDSLMECGLHKVAKAYINYRKERDIARESGSKLLQDIEQFINQSSDEFLKENANKDTGVVSTHRDLLAGILSKHIAVNHLLPEDIAEAHKKGVIHVHDLDYALSPLCNCLDQSTWVTIRDNKGNIETLQMIDLVEKYNLSEGPNKLNDKVQVLSRNGWSELQYISVRKLEKDEPLYNIRTRNGLRLLATGEHKVPVTVGEVETLKEVKDICVGESLLGQAPNISIEGDGVLNLIDWVTDDKIYVTSLERLKRYIEFKYGVSLQKLLDDNDIDTTANANMKTLQVNVFRKLAERISIPYDVYSTLELTRAGGKYKVTPLVQVSNELARMVGYVLADGCVSKSEKSGSYHVTFSNTSEYLLDDYKHCVEKAFPSVKVCRTTPTEASTTPCTHMIISNATITDFFQKMKRNSGDICLPDFIVNGDEEIKYNFLAAAFDCDGHWRDMQVGYTTVCEKYAQQIMLILESLGFNPCISKSNSKGSIYKAREIIGKRNYDTWNIRLTKHSDIIKLKEAVSSWKGDKYTKIDRKGVTHNPDKIVEIKKEYHNFRLVFDFQTSDHWFIANNFVVHNCSNVNYQDMLANGFKIGDAQIETPKSIGTACTVLTQIAQAVASAQYGGQTMAHIDFGLEPYVKASYGKLLTKHPNDSEDDPFDFAAKKRWVLLKKEVYDAMQTLLYQINTLTTSNGQTPFITLTLGLNTSPFGRMITEQYLKVHMEGIGKDKATPVFPKVVFFLQEGVNMNEGDCNYDLKKLAVECSSKRIYPDYISVPKNLDITGNNGLPVSPMGCRSFLSGREDGKTDGRFNLGVVSINLPYIALASNGNEKQFYSNLYQEMDKAFGAHIWRVNRLKHTKAKQNPIMWMQGACARLEAEETIEQLFYDGYASISIGFVGLYEAVEILKGSADKSAAMRIVTFMKGRCDIFKQASGLSFSLYGTPSESLCYKAATACKRDFGEHSIKYDFLTNSFHYPVWIKCHPMEKWEWEKGFAEIVSGGNISYVETPNLQKNLQGYEGLLDYAYHLGLHYFAINTPVDKCYKCGFEGEFTASVEGFVCPSCGNDDAATINVLRRVSGYISAPNSRPFNKGKQQEVVERVKHFHGARACG